MQSEYSIHGLFFSINITGKVLDLRISSLFKNSAGFISRIKYKADLFKEIMPIKISFLNTEINFTNKVKFTYSQ